jgi:hypothetical protein
VHHRLVPIDLIGAVPIQQHWIGTAFEEERHHQITNQTWMGLVMKIK